MQDLWADFAGDVLPTEENGRRGRLRQRRLTEQTTLMALRAWLLQEYMLPYGISLGNTRIFQRCYWIDALGSPGPTTQMISASFASDEIPVPDRRARKQTLPPTSPLPLALQPVTLIARQLAQRERPIALSGLLLDKKNKRKQADPPPDTQVGDAPLSLKESNLLPGTWPELAPALLSALEQSAAVFLLNPLKDDLFRYADLAPLYQRTAPTELFFWLSHKQIETRLLPALRTTEGANALTNLLRGDRWKSLVAKEGSTENLAPIIQGLIDLFIESMRSHFLSVQRLAFPIRTGLALVEGAPYTLLFATRRQDSLASLSDALCRRERRLVFESQQGVLNEAWFAAQREEMTATRITTLTQEMLSLGRAYRPRRWPELRQQLLLAHFGQYTQQDYDDVLISLLARGEVRCEWRTKTPEDASVQLPGNNDLLLWK
jgi:hypothetical protein